jgi:hypothetical protein
VVTAVGRLVRCAGREICIVVRPGAVRGNVGNELLSGLLTVANIGTVLVMAEGDRLPPSCPPLSAADSLLVRDAVRKHSGNRAANITLPDGSTHSAGRVADALVATAPGRQLVYATDLADTPGNRKPLIALARGADTMFCEAGFLAAERRHADRNGHLTARACGEIAAAAGVRRLVPFHFSKRYEARPASIVGQVAAACPPVAVSPPAGLT